MNFLSRILLFFLLIPVLAGANEGMWIPSLLKKLNEQDLKARGLKIPVEQIWSTDKASLKDAIVQFGGGCTAEVISYKGLLLTNHHCGYSQIQSHSTIEKDYLRDGFWARSFDEELPNPGLTAMFVVSMEDVTEIVFKEAKNESGKIVASRLKKITEELISQKTKGTHYEAELVPFNYGNSYFLIVTETFLDVRLVGAPPSAVGKFGGDTDNWVWPRHTGDFSIFRIYADKNNKPAAYSKENVPYQPKYALSVSKAGVKEGDFTMVFGFPGRTQQFLSSAAVDHIVNNSNPARIKMREKALKIIDGDMISSDALRIKYAAKQARISNAYKKWIGETKGLIRLNAIEKKKLFEADYVNRASLNSDHQKWYGTIPSKFNKLYTSFKPYATANDYFSELVFSGPEFLRYVQRYEGMVEFYLDETKKSAVEETLKKNKSSVSGFFKNYNPETDKKIFLALFPLYIEGTPANLLPDELEDLKKKYKGDWNLLANEIYTKSFFTNEKRLTDLLNSFSEKSIKKVKADPAYLLMRTLYNGYRNKVDAMYQTYFNQIEELMNDYVAGMMILIPEKKYWFDANSTLRLSYGIVEGSKPHDGYSYDYYTTAQGMMEKYIPNDSEFDLPKKLIELIRDKNFGTYGNADELRVCFTASNHTTGGNSGSPVLDAYGNLIGINFDRSWESTMSDVMYDPMICRNIILDARYILFIIEKYAGADHLIQEMNIKGGREILLDETVMTENEIKIMNSSDQLKDAEFYYQRASRLMKLKKYNEAESDIELGIKSSSVINEKLQLLKANVLIAGGKYNNASLVCDLLIRQNPTLYEANYLKALSLTELKKFDEAIKWYTACIRLKPLDALAHFNRGICYYNIGKIVEACSDFMMAEKEGADVKEWPRKQLCR